MTIFASGGLDEDELAVFAQENAPIDGLGIGTSLTTSSDVPALDVVYKLQEYAGVAAAQALGGQGDLAGAQAGVAALWRGRPHGGRYALAGARCRSRRRAEENGEPLVRLVMKGGRRVAPAPSLEDIRRHSKRELERLPEPLRRLQPDAVYPVDVAAFFASSPTKSTAAFSPRRKNKPRTGAQGSAVD